MANSVLVCAAVCLIGTATFGGGRFPTLKKWHLVPPRHSCLCTQATLRYIPILTAMKSSNINSLLISTLQVPKNCNISQKRISRTSSTHGALQRCDPMNAEFHVCYSRFIFQCQTALVDPGLLTVQIYRSHKTTHHSQQESSGRVIGPCQRRLPGNTQHSQDTDIHAPGGIRSRNLRKRAAPDPRLRSHSHWNRHSGSDV